MAIESMPWAAAASTSSVIRPRPSSRLNSEWTWRWVKSLGARVTDAKSTGRQEARPTGAWPRAGRSRRADAVGLRLASSPSPIGGSPVEAISGLLFLGALALLIGGAVAAVVNRIRPAVGRDKIVRPDLPSGLLLGLGAVALVASLALSAFIQVPA